MVGDVHLSISLLQNCNLIQIFHTRRVRKDQLQVNVPFWRHTVPPHCPLDTVCYRVSFLGLVYVSIFSLRCHEVFQCSLWSLWMNSDVIHLTSCSHFICSTCWKGHKTNRNIPVQRAALEYKQAAHRGIIHKTVCSCLCLSISQKQPQKRARWT